jgi:hypothetical protein
VERTSHPRPRGKTRRCGRGTRCCLVVHHSCFIVVPRPLPPCASQVLDRGAQAIARGAVTLPAGEEQLGRCTAKQGKYYRP